MHSTMKLQVLALSFAFCVPVLSEELQIKPVCDDPTAAKASIANQPSPVALLIVDARKLKGEKGTAKFHFFVDDGDETRAGQFRKAIDQVRTAIDNDCTTPPTFDDLADAIAKLPNPPVSRWLGTRGDNLIVGIIYEATQSFKVSVVEEKRELKLIEDARILGKLFGKADPAEKGAKPAVEFELGIYNLQLSRANLKIALAAPTATDKELASFSAITGPSEHFSLSANLPLNSVKQVKYDSSAKEVVTREAPKEFLVGLDWIAGDTLREPTSYLSLERIVVKLLARFSKEPLNTVGVGIGYRTSYGTIFGGPLWVREDQKIGENPDGSDIADQNSQYAMSWRIGLSFDVKRARDWFSDKTAKK